MAAECSPGREPGVTVEKEITKPSKRATEIDHLSVVLVDKTYVTRPHDGFVRFDSSRHL